MAGNALATQTPEERAKNLERARLSRLAKGEARRRSTLRRDYLDMPEWERLASEFGVRLPPHGEAPTPSVMRQFLGRLGRSVGWYYDESGDKSLRDFAANNPTWEARAWAGTVLEMHARALRTAARS
jgi:hypothetical protein